MQRAVNDGWTSSPSDLRLHASEPSGDPTEVHFLCPPEAFTTGRLVGRTTPSLPRRQQELYHSGYEPRPEDDRDPPCPRLSAFMSRMGSSTTLSRRHCFGTCTQPGVPMGDPLALTQGGPSNIADRRRKRLARRFTLRGSRQARGHSVVSPATCRAGGALAVFITAGGTSRAPSSRAICEARGRRRT
jgi:hypothetical protein